MKLLPLTVFAVCHLLGRREGRELWTLFSDSGVQKEERGLVPVEATGKSRTGCSVVHLSVWGRAAVRSVKKVAMFLGESSIKPSGLSEPTFQGASGTLSWHFTALESDCPAAFPSQHGAPNVTTFGVNVIECVLLLCIFFPGLALLGRKEETSKKKMLSPTFQTLC